MRPMAGAFNQKAAINNCYGNPIDQSLVKKSLRKESILRRDSMSLDARRSKDRAILDRLISMSEFKNARTVLVYAAFRSEVGTEHIIRKALAENRIVGLPRVERLTETLKLYSIEDWSDLAPGCWGILEPAERPDRTMDIKNIELVITPGAAFDEHCNRIGYGKGYYDKLLSGRKLELHPVVLGLAYEEQIVRSIPFDPHDMKMDLIITDKRDIRCHGPKEN